MQCEAIERGSSQHVSESIADQTSADARGREDDVANVVRATPPIILVRPKAEPLVQAPLPAPHGMALARAAECRGAATHLVIDDADSPPAEVAGALVVEIDEAVAVPVANAQPLPLLIDPEVVATATRERVGYGGADDNIL